jgi:hypothetical protein
MKYKLALKWMVMMGVINVTACCCGNGLFDNDQRVVTPALTYAPADAMLTDFSNQVNSFDH